MSFEPLLQASNTAAVGDLWQLPKDTRNIMGLDIMAVFEALG